MGRYQIGRAYWSDAVAYGMANLDYEIVVRDPEMGRLVMRWYFQRYCPVAYGTQDWATMARVHNGGPKGAEKQATIAYANKVLAAMTQ